MRVGSTEITKYLDDYRNGKIVQGLGIGATELDNAIRFKPGQFNLIVGLDNVGKTAVMLWYFLCLSNKHNLAWNIWAGENKPGQLVRQLIEFWQGVKVRDIDQSNLTYYQQQIEYWFRFVDPKGFYKNTDLYKIFEEDKETAGGLIDPFTGLDREYTHAANYNFLNESRNFVNRTGKTLYVNTHPNTAAGRRVYVAGEKEGYPFPPGKADSEGGQPFASRPDDIITLHRCVGHPQYGNISEWYTRKIKDTETGGEVCGIDSPVELEFNKGLGFTINGFNPLRPAEVVSNEPLPNITPSTDWTAPENEHPLNSDEPIF